MKRKPWIMVFGPDGGNMERMVMSFQRHGSNVRKVIPAAWAEPLNALDYAFGGVLPQDGSVDFSAAACRGLESHRLQSPSSAGFADLAEGPLPWNQEADTVYLPNTISKLPALRSLFLKHTTHFRARLEKGSWVFIYLSCGVMCLSVLGMCLLIRSACASVPN